jgi:hypothetical protein
MIREFRTAHGAPCRRIAYLAPNLGCTVHPHASVRLRVSPYTHAIYCRLLGERGDSMADSVEQELDELYTKVRNLFVYLDTLETSDFVVENGVDVTDQKIRETRDLICSIESQIDVLERQRSPTSMR